MALARASPAHADSRPIVLDYSYARPSNDQINSTGAVGVMRYTGGWGDPKLASAAEMQRLWSGGIAVGLFDETTGTRAGEGCAAGRADAIRANAQADGLGFPVDRPICATLDHSPSNSADTQPYMTCFAASSARPLGVYGSYWVVDYYRSQTHWLIQSAAWSGCGAGSGGSIWVADYRCSVRLSSGSLLFQLYGGVVLGGTDTNVVLADDWGGYLPGDSHPSTGPSTPPSVGDRTLSLGSTGQDVALWRTLIERAGIPCGGSDGIFGNATDSCVRAYQQRIGVTVDGVIGNETRDRTAAILAYVAGVTDAAPAPAAVPTFPGTVKLGTTGSATRQVQHRLHDRGWNVAVDGVAGRQTVDTIRRFQAEKHLTVDGIAGTATWTALWTAAIT